MTKEQINKYREIEKEIQPLKELMEFCGEKYRARHIFEPWKLRIRRFAQTFWLSAHGVPEYCSDVVIPAELQTEIVAVIENYIERREKEMEEL